MPLPHFTNIDSHMNLWEPVHKNLYECTIILPTVLQQIHKNATHLLMENTITATLPTYPDLQSKMQRFKYSTRIFVMMPDKTSIDDMSIKFNLNQNDDFQVFCWRILKDWYDLAWNNEDGSLHYKKSMIGDIIVHVHDKEGHVIRRVTYHNSQMKHFEGWTELDWEAVTEIVDFTAKFVADYWEDFYY